MGQGFAVTNMRLPQAFVEHHPGAPQPDATVLVPAGEPTLRSPRHPAASGDAALQPDCLGRESHR